MFLKKTDRLPRLLATLAEFRLRCAEVVVLDTGSDGGILEVAAVAGCRVVVESRRFSSRLSQKHVDRIQKAFSRSGEATLLRPGERLFKFALARNHAASIAQNDFQFAGR